ncbi:MAG: autotransporter-associated beta strand repeat-containing protein, partial [Verrucomicrobiota bacterium]
MKPLSHRALATSLITLFVTYSASAADQTWLPAGPSDLWNLTALNWDAGAIWTQNNNAIFGGTADTISVTVPITFDDMIFNSTGYTISSAGAGNLTLGNDFASTITVTTAGHTAAINETMADNTATASSLTKAGAGTLTLTGTANNTYSGGTTISAGTLTAGHVGSLGTGGVTNSA